MKRDDFEKLLEKALASFVQGQESTPPKRAKSRLGGGHYSASQKHVAASIKLLAESSSHHQPITVMSPNNLPPCF